MDSDLWISRLAAAKRHYSLHHRQQKDSSRSDRVNIEEYEVEEELRQEFACPYCYEEYDIASLCCHLEDEHPFETTVTVCPICSIKIPKDMLNHITLQHGQLFKLQRQRRLCRVAFPGSRALAFLGRDLREAHLQVIRGNGTYRSGSNHVPAVASDSLLSSLLLNFRSSETEEASKPMITLSDDDTKRCTTPSPGWKISYDLSLSHEELEHKMRQAAVRATFVQELLHSTLFGN